MTIRVSLPLPIYDVALMHIHTSNPKDIQPFLKHLFLPQSDSHKGQNGRVLVIGGSSLFHSASIWAAETASFFVDIVHYASTEENNAVFLSLKKKFQNGIVVSRKHIPDYMQEDDAVLVGPGMMRGGKNSKFEIRNSKFNELLKITDESLFTYLIIHYLICNFPEKRFVFDAGALQMMKKDWLLQLKTPPILTPHKGEFQQLFGESIEGKSEGDIQKTVEAHAKKYRCVILLKAVKDFISDGEHTFVVEGGNAGLTKGGTGDVLAGLSLGLYAKNNPFYSAVIASYLLKKSADELYKKQKGWFTVANLIQTIPQTLASLTLRD